MCVSWPLPCLLHCLSDLSTRLNLRSRALMSRASSPSRLVCKISQCLVGSVLLLPSLDPTSNRSLKSSQSCLFRFGREALSNDTMTIFAVSDSLGKMKRSRVFLITAILGPLALTSVKRPEVVVRGMKFELSPLDYRYFVVLSQYYCSRPIFLGALVFL